MKQRSAEAAYLSITVNTILGISASYLSDIINEKRDVTEEIAKFFGYERVWRKIK